jgi:hypothetical protein
MKKSIELLEDQIEELYDMVHMLMEYVDFDDVAHHEKETKMKMKMPPPPRLTSRK